MISLFNNQEQFDIRKAFDDRKWEIKMATNKIIE